MRHILAAVTIAAAATAVVTAQTLSELLQKGIYTEDTLGDTRAAVTIYRRVIGSVPAQHALAVQARRRLAAALEQSGTAQPIPAGPAEAAVPSGDTMGIVEHGRYRNLWTGVEFNIPVGWTAGRTVRSSDNGQQVAVIEPKTGTALSVWMIKEKRAAADVARELAAAPPEKLEQRVHLGYGIAGMVDGTYQIPTYTIRPFSAGRNQAIAAVGEYMRVPPPARTARMLLGLDTPLPASDAQASGPVLMNEYMAWIYTTETRAFFFGRVEAARLGEVVAAFDEIIQLAEVP